MYCQSEIVTSCNYSVTETEGVF